MCNNDNAEFLSSFRQKYPVKLELKKGHQGKHATFLELHISIVDGNFVY